MLILVGDNPERIRSEAEIAELCGVRPVPASSGKTTRHRLNRGGNRQANAALYQVMITRMRSHPPTLTYVEKRLDQGRTKLEIVQCLKRHVAREIIGHLCGFEERPQFAAVSPKRTFKAVGMPACLMLSTAPNELSPKRTSTASRRLSWSDHVPAFGEWPSLAP